MPGADILHHFIAPLEATGIQYMVTGSVAAIVYGEPRLTHDIDLVLDLKTEEVEPLIRSFPSSLFYCPPRELILVELARESRAHFNLIHHETGFKADCYLGSRDPLHLWGLQHRRRIELAPGLALWVAPPEYVILRKLEFYREGGSEKHLRDVASILDTSAPLLDTEFLSAKVVQLGLSAEWAKISPHRKR